MAGRSHTRRPVRFTIIRRRGQISEILTNSAVINHFLDVIKLSRASNTWISYAHDLKQFFDCLHKPLELIDRRDCLTFMKQQQKAGRSEATINRRLAAVSALFNELQLLDPERFAQNPVHPRTGRSQHSQSLYRRQAKRLPDTIAVEDLRQLFDALPTWRDRTLMLLMWISCLRVSEAVAIRFEDIECSRRSIRIAQAKGNHPRLVFMDRFTFAALNRYLDHERGRLFPEVPEAFIALKGKARGQPLTVNAVQKLVRYYAGQCGLSHLHPHLFRHTGITQLVQHKMPEPAIRKLVGHRHPDSLSPSHRITYDNLKAAVLRVLQGHTRQEQQAFIVFRSHYLFEGHFCTPGEGHEKGGVEHSVGFDRRNFLVPLPKANSFDELNAHLLACCLAEDQRQVTGQPTTIGEAWAREQSLLRPLPAHDYDCCHSVLVCLNPYSQVTFETNHYSVPTDQAYREFTLKAYPFRVDLLHDEELIARHPRCYDRGQDIFDPLHYLPLLEQRPGAFHHTKPLRRWRAEWPPVYEQLLARLQAEKPEGPGMREFIQILNLHRTYPAEQVEHAIRLALDYGCAHLDGVTLCLHQLQHPALPLPAVDLSDQPQLLGIGTQPLDLGCYDQLLSRRG